MGWSPLLVMLLGSLVSAQETCRSVDSDPYLLFGAKTNYIFANRKVPNYDRAHEIPGCQPVAFWMLNRHGSHNPEADEMEKLQALADIRNQIVNNHDREDYKTSNQRICESDFNLLRQWQWRSNQNLTFAGDLTSDGYINQQQRAQNWKQKYPGLFTENSHNYLFKYANDKRSATSFLAFTEGIFRSMYDTYDLPKENNDTIVKPYKYCNAWKNSVEDHPDTLSHRQIFESKQEYKEMITNVSLRLGYKYDLEAETVRNIYQMCRYNKAWDISQFSPWCSAFTREELRLLEYAEDLETYYKYGYGKELNKKIGCVYVKDMMNFFTKHVDNSDLPQQPRVMVHFTEAPAIMLALGAIGVHQDTVPLTGDNYHTAAIQARKWSTSNMSPFHANLAAALYKCTLNGNFQVNEQYQLLLLENDKPIALEWCRVGLCDWSKVVKNLGEVANTCDLEACNSASAIRFSVIALAAFVVRFVVL